MKLVLANLAPPPLLAGALLMVMMMLVMVTMVVVITMMTIIKLVLTNLAPYSSPEVFGLGASVMNRTMGWFFDANQRL